MENVEKIDSDVQSLRSELDRRDGKRKPHCDKRCKYLLGVAGLLLIMFLFGVLTRPEPKMVVVPESLAVLDLQHPHIPELDFNEHLSTLYSASLRDGALIPSAPLSVTLPRIRSWAPSAIGKQNSDGSIVPVTGAYEIPQGWFGVIRLLVDGEEVSASAVDARMLSSGGEGRFSLVPPPIVGEHVVRIAFDAVKSCRITCAPTDSLCMATKVNHCTALSDNQAFLVYTPSATESLPPIGQCATKIFVAGPKYTPQAPEDYTMCAKGMWNADLVTETEEWLTSTGLSESALAEVMTSLRPTLVSPTPAMGASGPVVWSVATSPGDSALQQSCVAKVTLAVHCVR